MPVEIPISCSIETKILGGDVAGGARRDGAAAELAEGGLEAVDPDRERSEHVGEGGAAGVVEVGGQLDGVAQPLAGEREELPHLTGVGHAGGVTEADLLRAGVAQTGGDLEHARGRDAALVGTAEGGGDDALAAQALLAGAHEHGLQRGERVGDGAVDVRAIVALRSGEEDVDLVDLPAVAERGVEATLVGDEHAHRNLLGDVHTLQHLGGVGELGDHVGAHEARDLQPPQPGARERVDQLHLARGGDDLGLVLKAVARPDLPDPHGAGRRRHHIDSPPLTPRV